MTTHTTIAAMNDQFRAQGATSHLQGCMFMTAGIAALPALTQAGILAKVQTFDAFTEDNDPHGEHDFGAFDVDGAGRIFWKVDYYADADMSAGSEDPADPARCFRVLTVMLAVEY